ncbi:zinc finger protein on ecdysone puffs [Halyomorpha halys]|uniref:zinc finger protein on ecdysone puffs n=1 Tax=Halyomorpha halys TaxID=286706 RepID=UPI0006D4FA75|nr:glutamic acid-rich protein-like [Halyomorpha halys]XP_014294324.1 glutamic acid-rich protein-like [Halyomorpha halys]XP_014294333.1 glutamic acid-rich protein-like [Halyomorpha halys]
MSYYKGGRGGGSGGYRGGSSYRGSRGGGESSWRGSRGGSFSSSRGSRYASYPSPTYDSRSRSSYGGSAADRYSRGRDEPYHRYSQDVNDYSRDYGRGMSPEPPRKRARGDTSPSYMATRRSHERSFASDYSSGRSYFDKGGASTTAGGYIGDKGYTREVRERGSDFAFRKPAAYSSPRGGGGYRGRSGRGVRSRGFRSTSSFLRKRDSFAIRKRAGLSSRSDYIRRLKQLRMRRRLRALRRAAKDSDEDAEQVEKDDEDDEVEEVEGSSGEEEVEEEEEEEEEEEDESNEKEQTGEDEIKSEVEGANEVKEGEGEEKKEGDEAAEDEAVKKEQPKQVKKKVVKKIKKVKVSAEKDDSKTEDGEKETEKEKEENEEESDKPMLTDFLGQPFIKLKCPHCLHLCVTFKEYSKHLDTRKHQKAMAELFTKLRKTLVNMRMEQRKKQRQIDDEMKAKNMHLKTFFCAICKLNYRSLKSQHLSSSAHRKMSEFLLPFCKICRIWFKSAWSYESHLCELTHIKRKARMEKLSRPPVSKDDGDMLDPSSFMILDSVGSGDDSDVDKSEDESGEKKEGKDENDKDEKVDKDSSGEPKKKKRSEIKLGAEFCKMVEVYYCDLCKLYLPRLDDKDKALTVHCRSRTHLQRYVRLNNTRKDDATLRRKAVRLHRERQKIKEKKEKEETTVKEEEEAVKPTDEEQMEVTEKPVEEQTEEANGEEVKEAVESPAKKNSEEDEEKMWSEVDKDLSDLLHDGDEPHDDEEDSRKERYDRFKQSDKPDKNSPAEADIKPNGDLPPAEKKKVSTDNEEN